MANGQTTGAALGEALAGSANTLLSFYLRKRDLEQQDRKLDLVERQQNKILAMEELTLLSKFTRPGTIQDNPHLHGALQELVGDDGLNFMRGIELREDAGFDDPFKALQFEWFKQQPPEIQNQILELGALKTSGADVESIAELDRDTLSAAVEKWSINQYANTFVNPDDATPEQRLEAFNLGRRAMGVDPIVQIPLPGGRSITVDSKDAAELMFSYMRIQQEDVRINQDLMNTLTSQTISVLDSAGLKPSPVKVRAMTQAQIQGNLDEFVRANPDMAMSGAVLQESLMGLNGNVTLMLNQLGPAGAQTQLVLDGMRQLHEAGLPADDLEKAAEGLMNSIGKFAEEEIGVNPFGGWKRQSWFSSVPSINFGEVPNDAGPAPSLADPGRAARAIGNRPQLEELFAPPGEGGTSVGAEALRRAYVEMFAEGEIGRPELRSQGLTAEQINSIVADARKLKEGQ